MKESDLQQLTEHLLDAYRSCSRLNHLGQDPLPSREAVAAIVADLFEVLYPGYGQRQNLHAGNIRHYIGGLIDTLHERLTEQIARALRHELSRESPHTDFLRLAQAKSEEFLRRLPQIHLMLDQDVAAAYRGDPAARSHHEIIFCYPGMDAITVYRCAHELHQLGVPFVPRMMTELAHQRTGIDIHPGARIGSGFFIDHGTGVVIGETCEIGRDVRLYQGVTLGALNFEREPDGELKHGSYKRHPTLRDGVVVYANATILGGHTVIGERCVIGSNVWITSSVPPDTTVLLEAPRLRLKNGRVVESAADPLMYFI